MTSKTVSDYLQNRLMQDAKEAVKEAIARQEALGIKPVYVEGTAKTGSFQSLPTPPAETSTR